ncbi:methyltransferase domain-containing protein [Candidatus Uhrbacteria bacterium]|nr:methyltransferase domain-containing protein [Candidatus Uhrbacteria bacterium]
MNTSCLSRLQCPTCHAALSFAGKSSDTELLDGALTCGDGHMFPVQGGIPDFATPQGAVRDGSAGQRTDSVDSFGFEWQWDHTPRTEEDLEFRVFAKPGIPKDFFQGKLVLDLGCGAGLQTQMMARHGATVIGVDLSEAVRSAYRNTEALRDRVCIIRGDVFRLPFAEGTFDYVYCEGVLQHTKDPKAAFYALVRLVKPGGQIFGTFYTRREGWFAPFLLLRQPLRWVLSRLPKRWCWYICWLSVPLNRVPVLKYVFRKTIVLYDPRNTSNKGIWCLNYDFYGPHQYQSYYRPSEITAMWDGAPRPLTIMHTEHGYPLRGRAHG